MTQKHLTVFSYNIHKGLNAQNTVCVMEKIKQELSQISPDIVLLQEVQGTGSRVKKQIPNRVEAPHHTYLAMEVWEHSAYGKNSVYKRGDHGNAILSKFPILYSENFNITTSILEKRGALYARVKLAGVNRKVHLLCTHFDLRKRGRALQLGKLSYILQNVAESRDIIILGGDFNDYQGVVSAHLAALGLHDSHKEVKGVPGRTFPSIFPFLPLDKIYYKGLTPKKAEVLTQPVWRKLSDHLPTLSAFEIEGFPP